MAGRTRQEGSNVEQLAAEAQLLRAAEAQLMQCSELSQTAK